MESSDNKKDDPYKDVLSDSETVLLMEDVEDLFASQQVIKAQQLYISYIKNGKRFAKLFANPDYVLGHIDILLTRGALGVLLPQYPFELHASELYARIRMRSTCPMSAQLMLPINHITTKFFVGCFGAILAQHVRCDIGGSKTPKLNASMIAYDPRGQKKEAVYTITISLASEDEDEEETDKIELYVID